MKYFRFLYGVYRPFYARRRYFEHTVFAKNGSGSVCSKSPTVDVAITTEYGKFDANLYWPFDGHTVDVMQTLSIYSGYASVLSQWSDDGRVLNVHGVRTRTTVNVWPTVVCVLPRDVITSKTTLYESMSTGTDNCVWTTLPEPRPEFFEPSRFTIRFDSKNGGRLKRNN